MCGLRIADLACGTGTLLNAAYQSVRARHRRAAGDDQHIHAGMMEGALIAADIMPAATHLTASILSGAHPTVPFGGTRIVADGVEQTAGYMDRCGAEAGHLVVFDRCEGRSWEEKVFRQSRTAESGAEIEVWGM